MLVKCCDPKEQSDRSCSVVCHNIENNYITEDYTKILEHGYPFVNPHVA